MRLSMLRIIRHYSASLFEIANNGWTLRRHAGLHPHRRAAQLHAGRRGPRPAPLDRSPMRSSSWRRGWACGCCSARPGMSARRWTARPITSAASPDLPISKMPRAPLPAPSRRACCASTCTARWRGISCCRACRAFGSCIPDIRLHISEMHQPLDMIREGLRLSPARRGTGRQSADQAAPGDAGKGHLRQPRLSRAASARRRRPTIWRDTKWSA